MQLFLRIMHFYFFSNLWKSLRICDGCARAAYRQSGDGRGDSGEEEKKEKWGRRRRGGVSLLLTANISTRRKGSNSNMFQVKRIFTRAPSRQIFPQKFWVKSESTPGFLSKNLSLKRKIAINFNSRQKYPFRTNIEFSRKSTYLQLKPI